ncbi:HD-GYP domain-containing protein [Gemmatimonadota bacterium]
MSPASEFLVSLAQAISTMNLYGDGHPARERSLDLVFQKVQLLQEEDPTPEFTFMGDEVVLGQRPLAELRGWDWSSRFSSVGVERLEFLGAVTRDELEGFLEEVLDRLTRRPQDTAEARQMRATNIRFGTVGTREDTDQDGLAFEDELASATLAFTLREEADTVRWIHGELQAQRDLSLVEADAVVRSLSVAMHGEQAVLMPLLRLKEFDQYTTTHALNVSVLSMALSEFIGFGRKEVRRFGIAGLLHDLGKVKVPPEILNKPGKLTEEERRVMNTHPEEGAKIILAAEDQLDLAAVVAYEHHIKINGGGYPKLTHPRKCHHASDLVHVCDVFDALRTDRPYRGAMSTAKALGVIRQGAGEEFHPRLARSFIDMMEQWETRVAELANEDQVLLLGQPGFTGGSVPGPEDGGEKPRDGED